MVTALTISPRRWRELRRLPFQPTLSGAPVEQLGPLGPLGPLGALGPLGTLGFMALAPTVPAPIVPAVAQEVASQMQARFLDMGKTYATRGSAKKGRREFLSG